MGSPRFDGRKCLQISLVECLYLNRKFLLEENNNSQRYLAIPEEKVRREGKVTAYIMFICEVGHGS